MFIVQSNNQFRQQYSYIYVWTFSEWSDAEKLFSDSVLHGRLGRYISGRGNLQLACGPPIVSELPSKISSFRLVSLWTWRLPKVTKNIEFLYFVLPGNRLVFPLLSCLWSQVQQIRWTQNLKIKKNYEKLPIF